MTQVAFKDTTSIKCTAKVNGTTINNVELRVGYSSNYSAGISCSYSENEATSFKVDIANL